MSGRQRIDVHHHILPPPYTSWLASQGIEAAGGRAFPAWSVESTMRMMEENEIAKAIVSVSAPGVHPDANTRDDAAARGMAREVNEFSARVRADHPDRFGFFATLTLPDVEGALAEAEYALDQLGAAGVILLANTHGEYLGERAHAELYAELDRRRAVVFVHPSSLPGPSVPGIPAISGTPAALPSLLAFAKPGHVLYGSDWPFLPALPIRAFTGMLDGHAALDADGHAAIDRTNSRALFEE